MNLLEKYQTEYQDSVRINYHEPTGLYILRYLHNGVDFTDPLLRMARSLVLDSEGNIIMRGFNKFFCHRQYDTREEIPESFKVEYTRLIVPDADHEVTFWEKYDGTCITVGLYNDDYIIATPRALELPPYAPRVRKLLADTPQVKEWLKVNPGHALVFEYISPDNLINVRYDYEALVLLAVTDIENGAKHPDVAIELGKELGFMTPTVYKMNMRQVAEIQAEAKDIEGFVAVNHAGNLIKFKADDLFNANLGGREILKREQVPGRIRYVTNSLLNNGVSAHVGNEEAVVACENEITIAQSGSVGADCVFFQPSPYAPTERVIRLTSIGFDLDPAVGVYMTTAFRRFMSKYNYGYQPNPKYVSRDIVSLPIDDAGVPDWGLIREYMQALSG